MESVEDIKAWLWSRQRQYLVLNSKERLLSADDDSSDGSIDSEKALRSTNHASTARGCLSWLTVLNLACLAITITLTAVNYWSFNGFNAGVKETSSYSPIHRDLFIELQTVELNGTLFPGTDPSWSRKEPGTPETEEMWESFEFMHTFPITHDDVIALGKDPDTVARYPEEVFGLGDNAYIGALDVQHKLHCLNELRKMAFLDYGDQDPMKKRHGKLWWIHLRHCMDMITQDMICHADADIITYQWVDTQPNPFPDFSLNRQCRSLDALIQWRNEHRVDPDTYLNMEKPKSGIHQVPMDREYYSVYGFEDSDLYPNGKGFGELAKIDRFFGVPPSR